MAFKLEHTGSFRVFNASAEKLNKGGLVLRIYISLIVSMIAGRIVYALVLFVMGRILAMKVPAPATVWSSVIFGIPGIILQLILVPGIVLALYKTQNR